MLKKNFNKNKKDLMNPLVSAGFTLAEVLIAKRGRGKMSLLNLFRMSELKAPSSAFQKQYAFTLAEVLITLGIIGIVAAMTIPSLLQSQRDKATVVALKKTYSIFSQAYQRAVADNGSVLGWDLGTKSAYDGALKVENYFKPYLLLAKDCAANGGCFPAHYFQVSGIEDSFVGNTFAMANLTYATLILADGSIVAFWSGGPDQNGYVIVDINGEKGPNTHGIDTFWFYFDDKNFSPWSMVWGQRQPPVDNSVTSHCDKTKTASDANNGRTCTAWVLSNENLDYLHCSDLAWGSKVTCN